MPVQKPNQPPAALNPLRRLASLPLALLLGALPALALLLGASNAAQASSGTVSNCANDSQFSALLAGGGAIVFNCGAGPVTITVTSQHVITQPTSIDGGGLVTLDGGQATRFFSVTAGARLSLANLTLYHGQVISASGGAIYNAGDLTLLNMTLVSNTTVNEPGTGAGVFNAAGGRLIITDSAFIQNLAFGYNGGAGIFSNGALTVTGSTFRDNRVANDGLGGGIQTYSGTALIVNSAFLSNTSGYGGAIDNEGASSLTLIGSLLAYNLATFDGGAIDIDSGAAQTYISDTFAYNRSPGFGGGGAIWNDSQLRIQDSAFVGNSTGTLTTTVSFGGAIYHSGGALTLTNSTLYHNVANQGGGIDNRDEMYLINTTLFSNTATVSNGGGNLYLDARAPYLLNTIVASGGPNNCASGGGSMLSLGHNLESANTCGLDGAGDITNTNPLLGPLASNGGPTLTLALLPGSPGINQGDNTDCPAADQRGGARPVNGVCDIGAYEFGARIARILLPLVRR